VSWAFRLAALVAVGLGLVGLIALVDGWLTSHAYERWRSVPGKITYSEVVSGIGCGPGNTMSSMVIYEYEVEGVGYSSFTISHGMDGGGCGTQLAETYPEGKRVTVYYDPADPRDAVLKRTEMHPATAIVTGLLLAGMVFFGFMGWRYMGRGDG